MSLSTLCLRLPSKQSALSSRGARSQAAEREQVDGVTAAEMLREDWLELGASGLKASKIMATLSRLQREVADGR